VTTKRKNPAPAASKTPHGPYDGPERRRSRRESHFVTATLQPASGDASVDRHVVVFDISLGGVGFRAPYTYRVGTVYRITLGTGPLFLNARLRVVSCRQRDDGMFDIGSAFC
jgi:hypothetical protein